MKKIVCFACVLLLLTTAVSVPSVLAIGTDFTGEWVCQSVDWGDGELVTEYQGQSLPDALNIDIQADGTVTLNSFGEQVDGMWQPTGAGISIVTEGTVVPFTYADGQLVNTENDVTMYFVRKDEATTQGGFSTLVNLGKGDETRQFQFAGTWNAVTYNAMGIESSIDAFFPDGLILTLSEDGAGTVALTPEYSETVTWSETADGIAMDGSNFLYNPVWDPESETLSFNYASDIIQIAFSKDGTPAPTAEPTEGPTEGNTMDSTLSQVYTCDYFSIAFPAGWEQDEYGTYDWDDAFSVQYNDNDADGYSIGSVQLTASAEDVADYRITLNTLQTYASDAGKDALDELVVDGVTFQGVTYGDYWHYADYTARVPEAGITLDISIASPEELADVLPAIFDSIQFTYPIPDPPLSDPPLPEDGVAYTPLTATVSIGGFDVTATWLKPETPIVTLDSYDNSLAAIDNTVYVLSGQKLNIFNRDGVQLIPAGAPVKLDDTYRNLSVTWDGTLYITDGYYQGQIYKGGMLEPFDIDSYLAMSPEDQWGLSYWASYDVKKITFTPDGMATKSWALTGLDDDATRKGRFNSVSYITITPDAVYVAGTDVTANNATIIAKYDFDGNELATFGSADWSDDSAFGSVEGIVQTDNGILVMDGLYGDFKLFASDGTFIGYIDCDTLLGTDYPWLTTLVASGNGALALVSQEREDQSATELLVFEITGF